MRPGTLTRPRATRPRTMTRRLTLAAGTLLLAAAPAAAQEFSIQQVMSSPFPSDLTSAPQNSLVAWVQNAEGVRNIWVASAPDFSGRRLTAYSDDDGEAISDLRFTPDGSYLLFVRGGGPNRQGEIPNPTSSADGAERSIQLVALRGDGAGEPRLLTSGSSPRVSPDGRWLAYSDRGLKIAPLEPAADSAPGPEHEPVLRGGAGSVRWSPDGSRVAFVSGRGDHSFIGVYELESRTVRYLDPSLDRDGSPAWSPDGRHIAFLRQPNERDRLPFAPRREGLPWSIRVADTDGGSAREVWRALEGTGSVFRGVVAADQLMWAAGDHLVFPWEREGWTHLYSVQVSGGEAAHLTPGAFEVEDVRLAAGGQHVLYSSNQDDVDRRHLWRVPAAGGAPERLTPGDGIEWSPVSADEAGTVAFLASDASLPAHAALLDPDGQRRGLAPRSLPSDFPTDALVEPQPVVFSASDGMPIHGQLFLPRDLRPGDRRPAAIFFHGGSRRQMLLGWHYRGYYHNAYALNQYLASRGYVVLSVNYRSGIGYGLDFREAIDYGARGASEFHDVMGAGLYLRGRDDVDPSRIGLWGGSYGGYLTALGLARASDLFAAGVDLHGVHDWNVVIRNFVPGYDPVARDAAARLAFESSPMASIDGWRSPVLLIHGDDDRNVPFSESVDLVEALRRRDVEVEQLVFPDEVHGFLLHRNWLAAFRAAADFMDRKLGPRTTTAGRRDGSE